MSVEKTSKRDDSESDEDTDANDVGNDISDDFGSTDEVKVFKDEDEQETDCAKKLFCLNWQLTAGIIANMFDYWPIQLFISFFFKWAKPGLCCLFSFFSHDNIEYKFDYEV